MISCNPQLYEGSTKSGKTKARKMKEERDQGGSAGMCLQWPRGYSLEFLPQGGPEVGESLKGTKTQSSQA